MYLNSTIKQAVWNTIEQTIEKPAKNIFPVAKHVKNKEKTLKKIVNFKNLRHVFQTLTNKKYLEITYAKTTRLINAQHLTMYEKT